MLPEKSREYQAAQQVWQNKSDEEIIRISVNQFEKNDVPNDAEDQNRAYLFSIACFRKILRINNAAKECGEKNGKNYNCCPIIKLWFFFKGIFDHAGELLVSG